VNSGKRIRDRVQPVFVRKGRKPARHGQAPPKNPKQKKFRLSPKEIPRAAANEQMACANPSRFNHQIDLKTGLPETRHALLRLQQGG
jgi:hypothetical protein